MLESLLIFIFGLILGSFLNCLLWRMHKGESFVYGRSYCPSCRHDLSFWDLFPLLSFLFLKGKCRYCKSKISYQYPLVELAVGALFLFVYIQTGITIEMFFLWIIMFLFVAIFVYDLRYYIIPDSFILIGIMTSFLWIIFSSWDISYLLSAIGASLFFFLIWFFSKGLAMGFGDVKLAFFLGLVLGYPNIITGVFLGFLFGAVIGTIMMLLQKKKLKSEIPFAPFLIAGSFVALFWGYDIMELYLSLMK